MSSPNKKAFKALCAAYVADPDHTLTLLDVGKVFGDDFWMLLVYAFLDANDAARAIQGSIARLAQQPLPEES